MANKAYRFRIYPNKEQQEFLAKCFGCRRFIYNYFLRLTTDTYVQSKKQLRYKDTARMLTGLKKQDVYSWLNEVNSQSLQQTLKDLEAAFVKFFKKLGQFPRFKKKISKQSFRVPQHWSITNNGMLKLPKMQPIKMVMHRQLEGKPTSVTISKTLSGKYYASIAVEYERPNTPLNGNIIAVDLGLTHFAITSSGDKYANPKYLRQAHKRLKRIQRALSRKIKGSNNRNKNRLIYARVHEKVANQRLNMQHKLSLKLTCENQTIILEDLSIKNMVKNHKLAAAISDAAWGQFVSMLHNKGELYGCEIKHVDKFFPSSKRCSNCGSIKKDLTLKIREWICPECKICHDRDINSTLNLLNFFDSTAGSVET